MSDDEASDDDVMDDEEFEKQTAQRLAQQAKNGARKSIVGERFQVSEDWKPPVHPKTDEQREQIKAAVSKSFMFAALDDDSFEQVINAFFGPQELGSGTEVIKQGAQVTGTEPGLFVIQSGTLGVFKSKEGDDGPGTKVFTYDKMGQSFGELALLYNCPRAATVVVNTDAVLWSIDRETFNHCVKGAAMQQMERREKFLNSVELFSSLSGNERSKIADILINQVYQKGDRVISRGEEGDCFFIVEQGAAYASADGSRVKEYSVGEYFGELALIREQARAVDVFADATPTKLLSLDRDSFKRMLGDLEGVLAERAKEYTRLDAAASGPEATAKAEAERTVTRSAALSPFGDYYRAHVAAGSCPPHCWEALHDPFLVNKRRPAEEGAAAGAVTDGAAKESLAGQTTDQEEGATAGVPVSVINAFREWDKAGTGTITRRRLAKMFKTLQPGFAEEEVQALLDGFGAPAEEAGRMDYMKFMNFVFKAAA